MSNQKRTVAVLGDGAFGTAIATLLARNGYLTYLWCYNHDVAENILKRRENKHFLPGVTLPEGIEATTYLAQAFEADVIFQAIPVPHLRSILVECKPYLKKEHIFVSLSKGIEQKTLKLSTQVIQDVFGVDTPCAALSGPTFAQDIALQQLSIAALAGKASLREVIAPLLRNDFFALDLSSDLLGVQYAGALKNVAALGVGFLAGAGLGCNTQVRFVLQSLKEMKTVIDAAGGKGDTLFGPAGIGDLMLTCFSSQSRNYKLGRTLGCGESNQAHENSITAEGVNTLASFCALGDKYGVSLPLGCALDKAINNGQPTKDAVAFVLAAL